MFEQAHRTAQREQLINAITTRLQRAPNLRLLLEGAAEELGRALGADQVYAEFTLRGSRAAGGDGNANQAKHGDGENQPAQTSQNGNDPEERPVDRPRREVGSKEDRGRDS